jgi:hypothetical protein
MLRVAWGHAGRESQLLPGYFSHEAQSNTSAVNFLLWIDRFWQMYVVSVGLFPKSAI